MADIIVKMLNPSVFTFHIKDRESFNVDLDMPVMVLDMPEASKEKATGTKLSGNIMKITISFKLIDWTGSVTTLVDELTGGSAILTPQQQLDFLLNTFESKSILHRYQLSISGASPAFSFEGVVDKINIEQSPETAMNFRCTLSFVVADVIEAA